VSARRAVRAVAGVVLRAARFVLMGLRRGRGNALALPVAGADGRCPEKKRECAMRSFATLVLAVLVLATPAFGATTGTLFGIVTAADGKPLPGVAVTLTSPALQGSRSVTTNAAGEYNAPLLPPGAYRVEYVLAGFETITREDVVVSLEQTNRVNVTLSLSRVSESVTVSGDKVVVDPTQTGVQQNFKEDYLKYASIGQSGRQYQSVMSQAAGSYDAGSGNPNVMGANLGQNAFLIDNLNTTDTVTHTFTANIGFEAIQEVSLQTAGYEAEYGKAVGGILNVITKSGGNNFSGSVDARYQSDAFVEQGERLQDYPAGTTNLANDKHKRDFQTLQPEAALGGPIVRDRIWFFANAQYVDNKNQPPNTNGFEPGSRDFNGWGLFGKITATPVSNQTATIRYTNSYADIPFSDNSSAVRPEAATDTYQKTVLLNASYDAVLSANWLAILQGGVANNYLIAQPHSGDIATTGSVDLVTGISSVNATNFQRSHRDRTQVLGSTTYYVNALGSHGLKAGTDLEWTSFPTINNATGTPLDPAWCSPTFFQPAGAKCGAINLPANGQPSRYDVFTLIPEQDFKGRGMAFYAQDEWRPVPTLTIKAGARYDQQNFYGNEGDRVKVFARFQPRLGFAWDILGDASTIFRAHAGEFMDDNALTLPFFTSTLGTVDSIFLWSRSRQQYVFVGAFGGPSGNSIDPSLKPTYAQEISGGITRRLFTNTSLDVTAVYRRNKSIFEDSCRVDNCQGDDTSFWLTNRPNGMDVLRSEYKGIIVKVESRATSWLNVLLNYTVSKSQGSVGYTQNQGSDFDVFPDHFINRFGYLSDDARHRVTMSGFAKLPFDLIFGTNVYWDSGVPYNVTSTNAPTAGYGVVYLEPRGSRRLPHFYQWDAQLQKDFVLGPVRLGLVASVFNILDTEIATAKDGSVGDGTLDEPTNPRFNLATAWQRPRNYEVGFRLEF
jgi:carboxypeptidase family protein/TonB-dependent receptor-like protein